MLKLRHVRASLGLTQRGLAEKAGLSEQTIIDAERGRKQLRLTTAYAILSVLNPLLVAKGRSELGIDDLDWNVQDE